MHEEARRIAAPLLAAVHRVPGREFRSCEICHSSKDDAFDRCYRCNEGFRLLNGNVPRILPITMSLERGQMHHALRDYKDGWDQTIRERFSWQIAGLVELFAAQHTECLGEFDVVTCIPSRKQRTAFEAVVTRLGRFRERYEPLLAVAGADDSHTLSSGRFVAAGTARGRRVLILEDTFTTGASVFSATAALRAAGAVVDTVLVVGRHMNPGYSHTTVLLDRMKGLQWVESDCVVCRPAETLF